ncbi:uncharacterized protein LOC101745283 isoform X1 [Bombyx mori]|uniref:Uncharacterized protein n=3 Tax=Bombyx mori TaxID=7091 RepID=A0A8R2R3P0_BOMMO|nr:uncharacterized protein LOC101745283 isoform X1 [Bombyx mori]XP_037876303.1 uncharacterized protein LOC101745283 isoform X1 [Bombyx mori]
MALLLKSVWRNALRNTPICQTRRHTRSLTSSLTEVKHTKTPDPTMMSLKNAVTPGDVMGLVQSNLPQMTDQHMLQALRSLFQLQKNSNIENSEAVIKDPAFGLLCQHFKKHARQLDVNETIEAMKVLSYLGVSVNSLIVQTLLQIIRCEINSIGIRQIIFLDFILHRFKEKNHLVEALKMALPLAFQIHLPLEIDNDDMQLLKDMLAYCCHHNLPDRCINNVVAGLLLHDQDPASARSIVMYLSYVNCTEEVYPTRANLLKGCFSVLAENMDDLQYNEVVKVASRVKSRILDKHPEFYHEQMLDAMGDYVIKHKVGFEKALLIARIFSRIAHTHLGLVQYLCELAASSPTTLSEARTNILFGFINCLSNMNYIPPPPQWQEIQRQITTNAVLDSNNSILPWPKVCLELASLGIYKDKVIKHVFSEEFLNDYFSRDHNKILDYMQLFILRIATKTLHGVEYELSTDVMKETIAMYPVSALTDDVEVYLARGLGAPEYVTKNVIMPCGIISDLLICLKGGYPVPINRNCTDTKVHFEQLQLPSDALVVCILNFKEGCYSMNSNRLRGSFRLILDILEKEGYVTVGINVSQWLNSPGHERTPYLMREIGYKCGEIGIKLSAT